MVNLYKTQTENGVVLSTEAMNDGSLPVEIDSPYLTLEADRIVDMNKMQLSIHVMRNIQADETIEGRQQTGIFVGIMMPLGLTKSGCYTYARNVRNHLNGGDAYESNKKWNKKRADELKAEKANESTEEEVIEQNPLEEANRWCVENKDTKELLNSFTSRTAAQDYNRKLKSEGKNTRWFDKTKVA